MSTKKTGDNGELIAIRYLQNHGYHIRETNFKFGRFGEIDIVSSLDNKIVFIEVKYRNSTYFGTPEEAIIKSKLRKCKKTVEYYCAVNRISLESIRFDVITILKQKSSYKVTHYKNIEI
ncbi:MAG: YraN family protein [Candidatus Gracilibacteria bacterium]|nr:YraN family protein [Candidatus Gracilibacteria bacterium]